MRAAFKNFFSRQGGVAAVEFALVVPVLLTLFFGMVEVTRYLLISQKAEKLAHSSGDIVAQGEQISNAQLSTFLGAAVQIMRPYPFASEGVIIISSVYRGQGQAQPTIAWQRRGGGTMPANSRLGNQNTRPTLPAGFALEERENVIVAEVFYTYTPLVAGDLVGSRTIYHRAFYRPRLGMLNAAPG